MIRSAPASEPAAEPCPGVIFKFVRRADASLTAGEDRTLRRFLFGCFPHELAFLFRRHLRHRPAVRWLAFDPDDRIAGHLALIEKTIGTSSGELLVGGIAEIAVAARYRGRGIARAMVHEAHGWLRENGFGFAMLFGRPRIYQSMGYVRIDNPLLTANALARRWNPFCGKPMVCRLGGSPWPSGPVDLRGPTF